MKIIKIERDPEKSGIAYPAFKVTIKKWRPFKGWIESTDYYKDSGYEYVFGGGRTYYRSDGVKTGNGSTIGEAIDNFRNSF